SGNVAVHFLNAGLQVQILNPETRPGKAYGVCHFRPSRSSKASDSFGPQVPDEYFGTEAVLAALQTSRMGSTRDHAASTVSPRSKRVASPRRQSLTRVAYALREESPNPSR